MDANYEHRTLIGHNGTIRSVSFSPDGARVLTAQVGRGNNTPARIWDVATGSQLLTLGRGKVIQWAIFSPDGKHVLADESHMVSLWNAKTGKRKNVFRGEVHGMTPTAFSSDGAKLLLPVDDTVKVIDVATGRELLALSGHKGFVALAAFSPDDQRVVTYVSPYDQRHVTYARDQTVRVWNAATGREILKLDWLVGKKHSYSGGLEEIQYAAFTHDGRQILTVSSDFSFRTPDLDGSEMAPCLHFAGTAVSV